MAFLLAHENANEGLDKLAYLSCLRTIRDGAKLIAQAAEELVGQIQRHKVETDEVEPIRSETLHRLAEALHGRFRAEMAKNQFDDLISPKLIGNPLSDLRMTPGLPGIAALHNEVEAIREEYVRAQNQPKQKGVGPVGMRPGNKPNREQKTFIRDLAALYEEVRRSRPLMTRHRDRVRLSCASYTGFSGSSASKVNCRLIRTAIIRRRSGLCATCCDHGDIKSARIIFV